MRKFVPSVFVGVLAAIVVLMALVAPACKQSQVQAASDAAVDLAKIVTCVDTDLLKGMAPIDVAVDCGMKDAQAVEDLVGAVERLAAHRRTRSSDAAAE